MRKVEKLRLTVSDICLCSLTMVTLGNFAGVQRRAIRYSGKRGYPQGIILNREAYDRLKRGSHEKS